MQSLGLTEVAYQNAAVYAKERLQMRSLSGPKAPDKPADPIIVHPDVRKMLLTARAYAEGGRALALFTTLLLDRELASDDEDERKECADLVALLTPIVKAFFTDNAWIATSHCLQVFGGHGYIREWGMEQFVRDSRINMIYEGTNTIQSLDLLGRKVLSDNGAKLKKFGKLIEAFVEEEGTNEAMQEFVNPLADLGEQGHQADDRDRHEGVPEPRRGRRRRGRLPARLRPPRLRLPVGADGQGRAREGIVGRHVLRRQAGDGALLLRQAAAGDGRAHPQRARRRGADDGARRRSFLIGPEP